MSEVLVSVSTESMLNVSSTAARNARSSVDASIRASVNAKTSIVAMFGSIIPEPLPTTVSVAFPTGRETAFGCVSVVMMPEGAHHGIVLQHGGQARKRGLDLLDREVHADHPRRAHQNEGRIDAQRRRRRRAHAPGPCQAFGARPHVRDAAVHHDRLEPPTAHQLPPDDDRRAGNLVPREDGRRSRRHFGGEERQVVALGLDPTVRGRAAEATREAGRVVEGHGGFAGEREGSWSRRVQLRGGETVVPDRRDDVGPTLDRRGERPTPSGRAPSLRYVGDACARVDPLFVHTRLSIAPRVLSCPVRRGGADVTRCATPRAGRRGSPASPERWTQRAP